MDDVVEQRAEGTARLLVFFVLPVRTDDRRLGGVLEIIYDGSLISSRSDLHKGITFKFGKGTYQVVAQLLEDGIWTFKVAEKIAV